MNILFEEPVYYMINQLAIIWAAPLLIKVFVVAGNKRDILVLNKD